MFISHRTDFKIQIFAMFFIQMGRSGNDTILTREKYQA